MAKPLDSNPAGRTILIVDDEAGVLEVLEFILTDLGYSVVTALNGRDALMRVQENKPELIVLDLMMPVMDGAAATIHSSGSPIRLTRSSMRSRLCSTSANQKIASHLPSCGLANRAGKTRLPQDSIQY